jgi:YesN/AraC family two-component response regulator
MATDYIKTVQTRLTRKGTRLSKSQIREVYNQVVVAPLAPTEDELLSVMEQLEKQYQAPSHESASDLALAEQSSPIEQQESQPMTTAQPTAQPSTSTLATSQRSTLSQPSNSNLGITQQQIQEAVEQQFGKENIETKTAILNYVAQDTFATAQELQTALNKLRQMRLDILMKLIADHNQASSSDEDLLKQALQSATTNRQRETEDFFGNFENQLQQMRAAFGI